MRSFLWYLALVGLPLIGLVGILRVGEQLQPPPAVHGRYTVSFDSSGAGPCLSALVDSTDHSLRVSQSGPRLEIALGELEFAGRVAGDSVRAAVVADRAALRGGMCLAIDTVRIAATVLRTGIDVRLPGEFRFPGCTACRPVAFRATRVVTRTGEAGR